MPHWTLNAYCKVHILLYCSVHVYHNRQTIHAQVSYCIVITVVAGQNLIRCQLGPNRAVEIKGQSCVSVEISFSSFDLLSFVLELCLSIDNVHLGNEVSSRSQKLYSQLLVNHITYFTYYTSAPMFSKCWDDLESWSSLSVPCCFWVFTHSTLVSTGHAFTS